ncbi:MAG: hypothetical protein MUE82_11115 [Chloroflexi bacterium]|nr:hypothetical protein [Chloroflexota bacterium]
MKLRFSLPPPVNRSDAWMKYVDPGYTITRSAPPYEEQAAKPSPENPWLHAKYAVRVASLKLEPAGSTVR